MGLRTRLQTASLIRKDLGLSAEQRRFAAIVEKQLTGVEIEESPNDGFGESRETWLESRNEADRAFYGLWQDALSEYAATRNAGNLADHNRFWLLLNGSQPFADCAYQDMLRARVLPELTRRRRKTSAAAKY